MRGLISTSPYGTGHMSFDASFYRALVHYSAAGSLLLDRAGVIQFANPIAARLLGENLMGAVFATRFAEGEQEKCVAFVSELAARKPTGAHSLFFGEAVRADGSRVRLEVRGVSVGRADGPEGVILTVVNATAWHEREQELIRAAQIDSLTGLPNRAVFHDRLRQAIRGGRGGVVAIADLDGFKSVNDAVGHQAGDRTLTVVAARLASVFPESVTVARFGGDEFAILLPGALPDQGREALEHAVRVIAEPLDMEGAALRPSISIGMAGFADADGVRAMNECDAAMYAAKARGGNQVVVYGHEVREFAGTRRELAARISALSEANAKLHRQARTDVWTGLGNRLALSEIEGMVFGNGSWATGGIVFVDLDHFGNYNHQYGDTAGDAALKRVAAGLLQSCRQSDQAFRKGGEEFVMFLPEVDADGAAQAGRRVRETIEALGIVYEQSPPGVLTATVGVSWGATGCTVGQCMAEAADLVMAAKLSGQRNCVHIRC
jgi:diguanylate cyclase (GGDEF)-like protein/PAS domain S-box-containing protein